MDQHRLLEFLRQGCLVGGTEVIAPLEVQPLVMQDFHGLVIAYTRERWLNSGQESSVPFQLLQFGFPSLQHSLHDVGDKLLAHMHTVFQVRVGHLRLHHPELRQVSAGLGFLGAESGPEAIDLLESGDAGLTV